MEHWSSIYEKLRNSIERLIPVTTEEISQSLHNRLLFLNRRWKEVVESVQQFQHGESIRRKREEFYAGRGKLLDVLNRIENDIHERVSCSTRVLKDQENRLYVRIEKFRLETKIFVVFQEAQADLDQFNHSVQNLARLSQSIARESGESNASDHFTGQICHFGVTLLDELQQLVFQQAIR